MEYEDGTGETGEVGGEYYGDQSAATIADNATQERKSTAGDYQDPQQISERQVSPKRNTRSKQSSRTAENTSRTAENTESNTQQTLNDIPQHVLDVFNKYDNDLVKVGEALIAASTALSKRPNSYTDDDWRAAFVANDKINDIPANRDGYQFKFEPVGDGHQDLMDDNDKQELATLAEYTGLNRSQANALYNFHNFVKNEKAIQSGHLRSKYIEENSTELEKAWGKSYDLQMARANRGFDIWGELIGVPKEKILNSIKTLAQEDSDKVIDVIANNAHLLQLLAVLGGEGAETPNTQAFYSNMTPRSAAIRLSEFKSDPHKMHLLASPWLPGHMEARAELSMITERKNNY
jgi:hypothetical protein